MELVALKGSEKQVNWAKSIRTDRLKAWRASDPAGFQAAEALFGQQAVASWWIVNKDKSLKEVCSQLQGGASPQSQKKPVAAAGDKAAPFPLREVNLTRVMRADTEEIWETVTTASGFRRIGPTRDCLTGEIVSDATLPF